ncbi:Flp pilus assembly protein, secretin CpaC [Terriglobus roseus DSM 18391]|uniref:Flp pilus assembly protein, secretin CpaC n=1 Tax=Terriglobus roseus (strain DSM 18391 / NRRL B-41598 / KBS 63) TaxID=926566 RepID=I3ZFR6_TERRK|nr:Flp pilus assembly protein, secretin CpaC [Terriglobus roseus]AFL88084.1 Flp pilus assembly protein, secretin CpaC [Terriglobus roseus DSM 18391]
MTASLPHRRGVSLGCIAALLLSPLAQAQTAAPTPKPLTPLSAKQRARAEDAYLSGAKHLSKAEFLPAEKDFARAIVVDPSRPEYVQALVLSREHRVTNLLQQAAATRPRDAAAADALVGQARALDRDNPRVTQHDGPTAIKPVRKMEVVGGVVLLHTNTRHSYHERSDIRTLASHIAADYGLKAVLDTEVPTKSYRIDVDDASYDEVMSVFSVLTNMMSVPLDEHTLLFAMDTVANRQRYERLVEAVYYLPAFTADQLKDFVSIAQNVLTLKQVSVKPGDGSLVVRGPADLVDAADKIFADLMTGGSDVVIDMKLYAIEKSRTQNLGVVLPSSLNAFSLASQAQSIVSANQSLITQLIASGVIPSTTSVYELAAYLVFVAGVGGTSSLLSNSFLIFGGGATTGVLSAGNIPTINLALNQSDARSLEDVQLRGSDRQTIIFKAGTRYPIQTSLFSDIASNASSALGNTTVNGVSLSSLLSQYLGTNSSGSNGIIPQFQYEDLGLVITAVPRILRTGDVSMHLEIKVSALSGAALNGIPILSSRQFSSDLTMADGDTALMVSDTTQNETTAVTGVPGLSELPGFQGGTNRNGTRSTGDLVLMLTPHIVRLGHRSPTGPYIALPPRPDDE